MGNESSSNEKIDKNKILKEKSKSKAKKNENDNKLDLVKEKKESKNLINTIITNIQLNKEIDETRELELEHLDEYIDSIFPENVPKDYIDKIRKDIYEIKNFQIGMQNNVKNIYEIQDIDNKNCCIFICSMRKVTENTINIAYKFNIIGVSIQSIKKNQNEIDEQEENKTLIKNAVNKEFQTLNEII